MIKLGVSACFMYPDPGRTVFGHKTLLYLEQDMSRFLSRPDVMPILIPNLPDNEFHSFLCEIDGFVFQGGTDVSPRSYGEESIEEGRWPGDYRRDQYELKILDFAVNSKKPILGICRGLQIMNVYFGGNLYQDISLQVKTPISHRDATIYDKNHHRIVCREKGIFEKIYKSTQELIVNSIHHQAIKQLGKNLTIEAICPDDQLIEAIAFDKPEEQFIVGVQWHPEFSYTLSDKVISSKPLIDCFMNSIKERK